MAQDCEYFMAVGGLSVSATAKYIGSVIVATGITTAAELVEITGLPRSTVYRAMTEFFAADGASLIRPTCLIRPTSENPICPTDGNLSEKPVSLVSPVGQSTPGISHAHASIASRATKELPSEVTLSKNIITPLIAPQAENALKTKPAKRGSRLPDDWQLPDGWREWTAVNCPTSTPERIDREALIFANYWQALAGAKACKADWEKTWRNWCFKTFSTAPLRPSQGIAFTPTAAERRAERTRKLLADIDAELAAGATH